jgi:uncharacterized protein (DUF433 family)
MRAGSTRHRARKARDAGPRTGNQGKRGTSAPRVLTTMRLRESLHKELEATAARTRRSVADVTQELLEEALRLRQCPGIYFADEPSGRTAKVGGTGLGVWEVVRDFSKDNDAERIRLAFPQLSQAQATAALMYYARYRDEVRATIAANDALTPKVLERRFPGLARSGRKGLPR